MDKVKKKPHIFLIFVLLLALTGMVYIGTDSFQIKEIIVVGNEKHDVDDIIKKSGISYEDNMLKLDKKLAKQRIEMDPYLEVISISNKYPHDVIIEIKEREAIAIIPYLNSYFMIDKECYILEIAKEVGDIQYPLIQDLGIKNFLVGKKLVAEEQYKLNALMKVLESMYSLELESQVSEIIMSDSDDIYLMLTDGIQVRIGQAVDMDKKLLWLESQKIKDVCRGIVGGILDLSAASRPVVIYPDES
ncbi:MAG TPA: FtsQ-type POTRA domain-containing protein [Clostridia bacterium]|nr:FtsQ-type POTRA domain-containing protein [Clostridia bacterium]